MIASFLLVVPLNQTFAANGADEYKSPFVLLPPIEWAGGDGSSPKEQAYFHGVLETYGFTIYGLWPRTAEAEQQFSDFRQCIQENIDRKWPLLDWAFGKGLDASAAAQMIRNSIPMVCNDYAGKGVSGWNPPRITRKSDWQAYDEEEQKFYVAAFIETAMELAVLQKQAEDVALLTECMKKRGLENVLSALKAIDVEWQYPMPWTISRAMGKACKVG